MPDAYFSGRKQRAEVEVILALSRAVGAFSQEPSSVAPPVLPREQSTRTDLRTARRLVAGRVITYIIHSARAERTRSRGQQPADEVAQPPRCPSGGFETGCLVRLTGGSRFYWLLLIGLSVFSCRSQFSFSGAQTPRTQHVSCCAARHSHSDH